MKIKQHTLTGLWVRDDGAVLMPPCKNIHRLKYTWSFGCPDKEGYLRIQCKGRTYKVHRLVVEAFRGPIPRNLVVDHINRVRSDNLLENIRIVTQSVNSRNSSSYDKCGELYGIHPCDDSAMYQRAYRKENVGLVENWKEHHSAYNKSYYVKNKEKVQARCKARLENLKALGKHERKCPDGKRRFLTDVEYIELYGSKGGV